MSKVLVAECSCPNGYPRMLPIVVVLDLSPEIKKSMRQFHKMFADAAKAAGLSQKELPMLVDMKFVPTKGFAEVYRNNTEAFAGAYHKTHKIYKKLPKGAEALESPFITLSVTSESVVIGVQLTQDLTGTEFLTDEIPWDVFDD